MNWEVCWGEEDLRVVRVGEVSEQEGKERALLAEGIRQKVTLDSEADRK